MPRKTITRRNFVKGVGATLTAPYFIGSKALGAAGKSPASDRIVMGAIGLGGRGRYDTRTFISNEQVQMAAVCDVRGKRRRAAKAMVDKHYGNKNCSAYIDFRKLLDRKDIGAVVIATGDNWHSMASIITAKAGKDMYCEKPMSLTVAEGRAVAETMKRYRTVYQCGTQRRSIERFEFAVKLARGGKLGKLKTLYAEKAPMKVEYYLRTLPPKPEPPREELDWDMWLGPAQWRAYNHKYVTRGFWNKHLDFSGGAITEWGSHTVDLCQWANDADSTGPVEFEPSEGTVIARYANGVKLVFEEGKWPLHVRFEGTEGKVYVDDDGNIRAEPKSLLESAEFGKGYPANNHIRNFLYCVKTRRETTSPAETAHRSVTACHIANICRRLGRKVRWDPERERFINDPMADRLAARAMRAPWHV